MCTEAGARVQTIVFLRDMNISELPTDTRKIEVVANGLPLFGGAQVAVDTTLVSALRGGGLPRAGADRRPGVAIRDAERSKRGRYPELVGGRWSSSAVSFVQSLAKAKARSCPKLLRRSAEQFVLQSMDCPARLCGTVRVCCYFVSRAVGG